MRILSCGAALAALGAAPAQAEVTGLTDAGFVSRNEVTVTASPGDAWLETVAINRWWSGDHTYSGDAANLYLDPQATGCFCEKLPVPKDALPGQRMGSVEHAHVVYADPVRRVLRMTGGLGPLQGEAVHATLTITFKPVEGGGTTIIWNYVVGGYMRMKMADIAPIVDKVLGEQVQRLGARLGPVEVAAAAAP
jgi:hypothetical protein